MNVWEEYKAYISNNPEGYWFKRKLYGWGWTPATRAGWLTTLLFVVVVLAAAMFAEWYPTVFSETEGLVVVLLSLVLFLLIACRTGEPPRWQWGRPDKTND